MRYGILLLIQPRATHLYQGFLVISTCEDCRHILQLSPTKQSLTAEAKLKIQSDSPFDALESKKQQHSSQHYWAPQEYQITQNLDALLRTLRLADEYGILWVDAICIAQDNAIEKTQQVGSIRLIYSLAWDVLVWSGQADAYSNILIEAHRVFASSVPEISLVERYRSLDDNNAGEEWNLVFARLSSGRSPWASLRDLKGRICTTPNVGAVRRLCRSMVFSPLVPQNLGHPWDRDGSHISQ